MDTRDELSNESKQNQENNIIQEVHTNVICAVYEKVAYSDSILLNKSQTNITEEVLHSDRSVEDSVSKDSACDVNILAKDNQKELDNNLNKDDLENKPEEDINDDESDINSDQPSEEIRGRAIISSDDENDTTEASLKTSKRTVHKKHVSRIDSDSESDHEAIVTPHNKSFEDVNLKGNNSTTTCNTNSIELISENPINEMKSRLSTLCDPDSEDESYSVSHQNYPSEDEIIEQTQHEIKKKSLKGIKKSRMQTNKQNEPKTMTPKEAAELRKEIQSESQRMLREKNVSLPYHKPKSHSLKEFLARRPKLASAIPIVGKAPPSIAIKMSTEQLEMISKQLKQREEKVKEFYKSESESEEDDEDAGDKDYVPPNTDETEKNTERDNIDEHIQSTEETNIDAGMKDKGDDLSCENDVDNTAIHTDTESPSETNFEDNLIQPMDECNNKITEDVDKKTNTGSNQIEEEPCTENYHFNLDDMSESPAIDVINNPILDTGNKDPVKDPAEPKKFVYTELDKEIEEFDPEKAVHDSSDEITSPPIKSKLELLKEKLANIQPRLSGDPNHVIDLDTGITKPTEVVQLMERFAKHTSVQKHNPKHKVNFSIVTVEMGGDVHKETVAVNVSDEEDTAPDEKPGARLKKLRKDLQNQMAQRNSEIWQQKAAKGMHKTEETENNEEQKDNEKDILDDDEEEAEMTDEEEYSDEEMYDDVELKDKPSKKSEFLDEEAEVSNDDEDDENADKPDFEEGVTDEDVEECVENELDENTNDSSQKHEDSNISSDINASEEAGTQKKVLRRIVPMVDDSDEEDFFQEDFANQIEVLNEHLDSTVTADEDDMIPPHQPRQLVTPIRAVTSQSKSITDFLTPISFITSIQNVASATKLKDPISPFRIPGNPLLQKQLFDNSDVLTSQGSLYSDSQETIKSTSELQSVSEHQGMMSEEPPSTQDLLEICSGQFTGITQVESKSVDFPVTQSQEIKSLDTEQDMIISQLLDEEELENFKKKFESPTVSISQRTTATEEFTGGGIIDSEDEDGENINLLNKKNRNKRRIQFSDDENSDDDVGDNEEEIDLHDEDEDVDNIGYDSEENEVDLIEGEKKGKLKLGDFLEAEAELSESEWGSEDEDEKGLDELEAELGDTEKFDDEQVKEDLEKIHMRRMLDDDAREVKILQELLLDDGELHGTGRQRQFKWKNIDNNDDQSEEKKGDDEIYMDEEESEEQWRRKRHEREMFLKEKQRKNGDLHDDPLSESQLLKLGQKVLQRSQSQTNSQNNTPNEKGNGDAENSLPKTSFQLITKRGSFLSRSDQVLQRVAEYTRVCTEISGSSSKTTKNFVFQSVSSLEVSVAAAESKKRKAADGTPNALKKLRLSSNFSPAIKRKLKNSERSKKLFNF